MKRNFTVAQKSLALILALFPFTGLSQFVAPESITFVGAEAVATEALPCAFAVQVARTNHNNQLVWTLLGSGFLVAKSNATFGVTCDHVIAGAEKVLSEPNALKVIFVGLDTLSNGYVRFQCIPIHRNKGSDIAILTVKAPMTHEGKQLFDLKSQKIGEDMIGNETSLALGRGVLILGYPLGLGVEANQNRPIVRFGMVAQAADANKFLIDGMASHGSSGSPVFSLRVPRTELIGMVTSFQNEAITLFDENGQTAARLPYNSGLAVAVKSSIILKALDEAANGR